MMTAIEMESEDEEEDMEGSKNLSAILDEYYGDADAEAYEDRGDDQYLSLNVLRRVMTTIPTKEEE